MRTAAESRSRGGLDATCPAWLEGASVREKEQGANRLSPADWSEETAQPLTRDWLEASDSSSFIAQRPGTVEMLEMFPRDTYGIHVILPDV